MKLKFQYLILIGLCFSVILFSCKTGPSKKELAGPPNQASLDTLAKGREAAEEARSRAEYVQGSAYCPDEWGQAEDRYGKAKVFPKPPTLADALSQTEEWKGLKTAYEDIYNKSLPQFAKEQGKILAAAREDAVNAGAEELVPDRFAQADAFADSSAKKLAANDYKGCVSEAKEALDRYNTLKAIAEAHNKQVEADNNNFFNVDPDNYMLAAEAGNNAVELYDKGDLPGAKAAADEALTRFDQVIKNGWVSRIEEKQAAANEAKAAADNVKANVAVKQDYDSALQVYNNAQRSLRSGDYAIAAELFDQSGGLFVKAYDNTVIKRDKAQDSIRTAKEKLAVSEEKVQTAAEIFGGE
jgi:hypothetical protein